MISTLHGLGVPQGVRPMHMGFEVMVPCAPRSGGTALRFILIPVRPQGRPHFHSANPGLEGGIPLG